MPKSSTRTKSAKSIIAAARRPERVVDICLRADVIADIGDLEAQLRVINNEQDVDVRMGDIPEANDIAEQISALEAVADENTIHLRLRALPRAAWESAMAKHPPSPEDKEDNWLVDRDTVVRYVLLEPFTADLPPTIVDSNDLDLDDATALIDGMTQGQWRTVRDVVIQLNGGDNQVPFSRIGWRARRPSDDPSKPPAPSGSPGDASTAGSRNGSSVSQTAIDKDIRLG